MRVAYRTSLDTDITDGFETAIIDTEQIKDISFHSAILGTAPAGSLTIHFSNEPQEDSALVTHWVPYTVGAVTVSTSGEFLINMPNIAAKWAKLVFVRTGGTGTAQVWAYGKGE
jgi:hypothetical protein